MMYKTCDSTKADISRTQHYTCIKTNDYLEHLPGGSGSLRRVRLRSAVLTATGP